MITGQEKVGCVECDGRGWIHSHDPFEIQRCDTCGVQGWTDTDAARAHVLDCRCDWPATDFQSMICRDLFHCLGACEAYPEVLNHIFNAHQRAEDRRGFIMNLKEISLEVGLALRAFDLHSTQPDDNFRDHIELICRNLLVVLSLVWTNAWKDHWVWDYEDGTVKEGKWYATRPPVLVAPPDTAGLSVLERGLAEGKTGDQIFAEIFVDELAKAAPQLEKINAIIEETKRRRPNPQLDYKMLFEVLSQAQESDFRDTIALCEKAKRHLLEVYPDADIPNRSDT